MILQQVAAAHYYWPEPATYGGYRACITRSPAFVFPIIILRRSSGLLLGDYCKIYRTRKTHRGLR